MAVLSLKNLLMEGAESLFVLDEGLSLVAAPLVGGIIAGDIDTCLGKVQLLYRQWFFFLVVVEDPYDRLKDVFSGVGNYPAHFVFQGDVSPDGIDPYVSDESVSELLVKMMVAPFIQLSQSLDSVEAVFVASCGGDGIVDITD